MSIRKFGGKATLGANTFTGDQIIKSTDAGAALGPTLDLFRDSATPAANDILGELAFNGNSSTGVKRKYASIRPNIRTATNGAEDADIKFYTLVAGSETLVAQAALTDWTFVGNLTTGAAKNIFFDTRAGISSPADAQLKFRNNAGTASAVVDVSTNNTFKFSDAAGTAAATMQFGTFAAGAGESFAGTITVKDYAGNSRKVAVFA